MWAAPLLALALLAGVAAAACWCGWRRRARAGGALAVKEREFAQAMGGSRADGDRVEARSLGDRLALPMARNESPEPARAEMPPSPPTIVRAGAGLAEQYSPMPTPIRPAAPKALAEFSARPPAPSLTAGLLGPPADNFALK